MAHGGTLWSHLPGADKPRRKRYARHDSRGRLAGKRSITERPAIVAQRARFGDWEIDTVLGRGKPCVVTAVERKCGLLRVGKLPRATAQNTTRRTVAIFANEPHPVRSLTSDNGTEFHGFKAIKRQLGARLSSARPHHAWECGTNGLLRQYLPSAFALPSKSTTPLSAPAGRSLPAASSSAPVLGSDLPATSLL